MTEFNKKLDESSSRIREIVQQQQRAAEAERQKQFASVHAREQAVEKSYGVALQFMESCIKPIVGQIGTKIPGGYTRCLTNKECGYHSQRLEFDSSEYLSLNVHFCESGVELSAEACCARTGIVYSQKSELIDATEFNEKDAQEWMESNALEAYEAFALQAEAIRNPPTVVTYNPTKARAGN